MGKGRKVSGHLVEGKGMAGQGNTEGVHGPAEEETGGKTVTQTAGART